MLKDLDLWSEPAERLILGTACVESDCGRYVHQVGDGPALGIYQMEPATHDDLHNSFLYGRTSLRGKVWNWRAATEVDASELTWNLAYATAMCRIHYLRVPALIPDYLAGQAAYWKKYYNTEAGKGTTDGYMNAWQRYVAPDIFV